MVSRKGMAKGTGKGYKNLMGSDSRVHSQSAKGVKQPQSLNPLMSATPKQINKNLPSFIVHKELTENEVTLLKRRLNDKKITIREVFEFQQEGFQITKAHQDKGLKWLKNLWKGKSGAERKNNPFGYREEQIIDNVDYIELADFHNNVNYPEEQRGIKNYQPYYRVVGKPDADGHRDTFEYFMGYSQDNPRSPIQILG